MTTESRLYPFLILVNKYGMIGGVNPPIIPHCGMAGQPASRPAGLPAGLPAGQDGGLPAGRPGGRPASWPIIPHCGMILGLMWDD